MSLPDRIRNRSRPPIPAGIAPRQLHPNESALSRITHQHLRDAIYLMASRHAHGRLVDIGCGRKPYASMLAPFVSEHVGVDHPDSPHALDAVDVLATAYDIPLSGGSFGTVLMSEVLEHLEEPTRALREAHRLLEPGGTLILTTPFIYVLHERPRDFFRYTPYALDYLLEQAGFSDIEVLPMSGQWVTIAILVGLALRPYRRGPLRFVVDGVGRVIQPIAEALDRLHFKADSSSHHVAVAVKH